MSDVIPLDPREVAREALMTVADAAKYLRKSDSWVYKRVAEGRLPHIKIGSSVRFDRKRLEEWVVSQMHH